MTASIPRASLLPSLATVVLTLVFDATVAGAAAAQGPAPSGEDSIGGVDALWRGDVRGGSVVWQSFGRAGDPRPRAAAAEGGPRWIVWESAGDDGGGVLERLSVDRPGVRLWLELDGEGLPLDPSSTSDAPQLLLGRWPFTRGARVLADHPHLQGLVRLRIGAPNASRSPAAVPTTLPTGAAPLPAILQRVRAGTQPLDESAPPERPQVSWERTLRGPGVVRELRFAPGAEDTDPAWSTAGTLEVLVDGTTTVQARLGALLGAAERPRTFTSRYLGRDADGCRWCRLPIPFADSVTVRVLQRAVVAPPPLTVEVAWSAEPVDRADDRTLWIEQQSVRAETDALGPVEGRALPASARSLRLVGLGMAVSLGEEGPWSGMIELPAAASAGPPGRIPLDALFGGGWQRIPERDGTWASTRASDGPGGFQGLLWFGPGAAPEFAVAPALRWGVRVWQFNGLAIDSTAYCYVPLAGLGSTAAVTEPAAGEPLFGALDADPPVAEGAAPLWFEGEDLQALGAVPGRIDTQDLRSYAGGRWSRDAHLFWTGPKPGDRLVLGVPVAEAGRYVLQLALTTARDYGQFRVRFAGQPMGETIELYTPEVRSTGLREVGRVAIDQAGTIPLEIEVVGKHPKAVEAYLFGLDAVRLVPLR